MVGQGQYPSALVQGGHDRGLGGIHLGRRPLAQGDVEFVVRTEPSDVARQAVAVIKAIADFVAVKQPRMPIVDDHLGPEGRKLPDQQIDLLALCKIDFGIVQALVDARCPQGAAPGDGAHRQVPE